MTLKSPSLLWLMMLVPLALFGYRRLLADRAARRERLAHEGLVLTTRSRSATWRQHLPFGMFILALASLLVSVARPQMAFGIPRREGTVILAFDVSNSMLATDLKPTRMDAAKAAAKQFVAKQPASIRIGIVAFGEGGFVSQRPTELRPDIDAAIDRLSPAGGTSLGQGIFSSLSAIAGKPIVVDPAALDSDGGEMNIGYFGSSAIVLLSDGEDTGGPDPLKLADVASSAGVRINTIGVGSPGGTTMTIDGFTVATKLDEALLTEIAKTTNGSYSVAADSEALAKVYDSVNLEFVNRSEPREVSAVFAGLGLLSLLIGAGLSLAWFGRVS
jgi:Ca-activated chloride channel homolog